MQISPPLGQGSDGCEIRVSQRWPSFLAGGFVYLKAVDGGLHGPTPP